MRKIGRRWPTGNDRYSKRIAEFAGSSLVAHWPLNELSGTTAYDISGNGNHGAITGTTLGQPGIGDGLYSQSFDGSTSYIDISAIASNLVTNGGFETAGAGGADIWANWVETASDGAVANETTLIHTGADAAKLTAGSTKSTRTTSAVTVIPGSTYRYRFWTRGDGTYQGRYAIWNGSLGEWLTAETATGVTGETYTMVDVEFTIPALTTSLSMGLYCPDTDGGVAYFDTVSLRRTDIPTFDPHEGTILTWAKVPDWTDGIISWPVYLGVDAFENAIAISKRDTNNAIQFDYFAKTTETISKTSVSETGFMALGMSWSLSGDAVKGYYNGVQEGSTQTGLGVFSGQLASNRTLLGARTSTPTQPFTGNEAHAQIYNKALSADEIAYLSRLP